MTREELKSQIDELMQQYANEEIDGATYQQKMMELTAAAQNAGDDD
jgi:adenine-specific DNA glycosylase